MSHFLALLIAQVPAFMAISELWAPVMVIAMLLIFLIILILIAKSKP